MHISVLYVPAMHTLYFKLLFCNAAARYVMTVCRSDVVSMRTKADHRDGHFVLNGTKMWCTNGTMASTLIVYAKTQADKGPHGITAFLIEKGMKACPCIACVEEALRTYSLLCRSLHQVLQHYSHCHTLDHSTYGGLCFQSLSAN